MRIHRFLLIGCISALLLGSSLFGAAHAAPEATLPESKLVLFQHNEDQSGPISEVTFHGEGKDKLGFLPGEFIHIEVKNPAGESLICDTLVAKNGDWACTVKLWLDNPVFGTYEYRIRGLTSRVILTGSFNNEGTLQGISLTMNEDKSPLNGKVAIDGVLNAELLVNTDNPDFKWVSTRFQIQQKTCINENDCEWHTTYTSECLDLPQPDIKGKVSDERVLIEDIFTDKVVGSNYRFLLTTHPDGQCEITNGTQSYYTNPFEVVANPTTTNLTCVSDEDETGKTWICEAAVARNAGSTGHPLGRVRLTADPTLKGLVLPQGCVLEPSEEGESVCRMIIKSDRSGDVSLRAEYVSEDERDNGSLSPAFALTFSVKNPIVTVTADALIKTYGQDDPVLTYTYSPSDRFIPFSGSLKREEGENTGVYEIGPGTLSASGYDLHFIPATLTVEKARAFIQTVGFNGAYDGQSHGVSGTASGVFGEDLSQLLEFGQTFKDVPGGISAWKFIGDGNYLAEEDLEVPVTIFPRELTMTADALTKEFGSPDPALTYSISAGSLVKGDTITGSLAREPGESAGLYFLDQGSLSTGSNYNLTFISAWFKIDKRLLVVAADPVRKEFGQADDPPLTFRILEGNLVGTDMFSGAIARSPGESPGVYGVTQGSLYLSENYELSFIPSTFEIVQASGQQDVDFDGVNNALDNCVFRSNNDQADADNDGFGDVCDVTDNRLVAAMFVPVTGASSLTLVNCDGDTVLTLEGGDHVVLPAGLCGAKASLASEPESSLPAALPQGFNFLSALNLVVVEGDSPQTQMSDLGSAHFSMVAPVPPTAARPLVFYWDDQQNESGAGWINIPGCLGLEHLSLHPGVAEEKREIIHCVDWDERTTVTFSTNFSGLFVLTTPVSNP